MTGDELRETFVRFFRERGHLELPSMPLIPRDDPSVLFVTAGMQQMIPFFLGQASPPSKRLVTVQKCLRTVDIEEVGDPSHLTFFEMLGNFSVGDYFVPEALEFTWDYLTGELALPVDRLWTTIYPGDDLALQSWVKIGMPRERIVEDPENWWTRPGLAGPAGPDSEVHFDRGSQYGCGEPECSPICKRCDRFVEIWNNVFMQSFVNEKNEVQQELAQKNIDTGQGFERILMAVQGKETVYETDVFAPVIDSIASVVGTTYKSDPAVDKSLRIIADHSRALTMAIADGALPGNEGRGYVLRRLLRRAVLRARLIGVVRPFLTQPVGEVIRIMSSRYPEVESGRTRILRTVQQEEERFAETLERGLPMVDDLMDRAREGDGIVPGDSAFLLHDTFGLPLDLIHEMAEERGLKVDDRGFEEALRVQQQRGRAGRPTSRGLNLENLATLSERVDPTEFTGYTELESEARVEGIIVAGRLVDEAHPGDDVDIILGRTPFYAESGGQVGDRGEILGKNSAVRIEDTQKPYGGLIVHKGAVVEGMVRVGDEVQASVDAKRRASIRPHHSATHLLHQALHEVLGAEATQAGSLVAPDRLRFDFRWPQAVTREQIGIIQDRINELVFEDDPVIIREMRYDQAVAKGATALFGEKYGDVVRMVSMGPSKELCGGTHVSDTVEIGPVIITSESGIGTGIRRIEALAGQAAYRHYRELEATLTAVAEGLESSPVRVPDRAREISASLRESEGRIAQLSRQLVVRQAADLVASAKHLNGAETPIRIIVHRVAADTRDDFIQLALATLGSLQSGIVIMGSIISEKPQFAAGITPDLAQKGLSAKEIAQKVGQEVGGGAGGDASFAQGGGRDPGKLDSGLQAAETLVRGSIPSSA